MKRKLIYLGAVLVVALGVFIIERPDLGLHGDADFEPLIVDYDACLLYTSPSPRD